MSLIPSILDFDLTPFAAVAALQLGAPEMMARGWSYYKFSEFGSGCVGVWEGVADSYSPTVGAGGLVALVTHGGLAPWGGRVTLPDSAGKLLSNSRSRYYKAGSTRTKRRESE